MTVETLDKISDELASINTQDPRTALDIILKEAIRRRASDLFLQPNSNHFVVSVRQTGIIRKMVVLSNEQGIQLVNLIKSSAGIDLTERRHPLDGRWSHEIDGTACDFRVNTLGTAHGEDLVLRLLLNASERIQLDGLGMVGSQANDLRGMLNRGSGLLLVTGPVGAGKSTTLYACLEHLNDGKRMIITLEDPIEHQIKGLRQCQVQPKIGLGFQELLRGVMRQSPDIIMIGEIRDEETAKTAVRAANSGHLVLSTLHSPLAAGAVQSMLAFGVNPYFLANSLLGIVAQRLIRELNPNTRKMFDISHAPDTFQEVSSYLEMGQGNVIYGPDETDPGSMEGYIGQSGLFELMPMNRTIKQLITQSADAGHIHSAALNAGMLDFRRAALLKLAQGVIGVDEMSRVIPAAEWDTQTEG